MSDSVLLRDPHGQLEGICHIGKGDQPPLALVLHPDPKLGGTMNNPVVVALFEACAARSFSVLRINFQGVGRSRATPEEGMMGELLDATSALDWLQTVHPSSKQCWVLGYSFGAHVAMQVLMRRPEITGFVAVAPLCSLHDFSFLAPCPTPGLFVVGKEDQVAKEEAVGRLVRHLRGQNNTQIEFSVLKRAGHLFEGQLDELKECIGGYLDKRLATSPRQG